MSINTKVAVLGLGIENLALCRFLQRQGEKIVVCDSRSAAELGERYHELGRYGMEFRLGPDYLEGLTDFDVVYRSPGLPLFEPHLARALAAGVRVTSPMRLFLELCPCYTIGVTGTKGKGTTSSLITRILSLDRKGKNGRVYLGGNIGIAPFEFMGELEPEDTVVLELSSFQLEDMDRSTRTAVVTNITEDHLSAADPLNPNFHHTREDYVRAKTNIFRHQDGDGITVLNMDDSSSRDLAGIVPGELLTYGSMPQPRGAWYQKRPGGGYVLYWNPAGVTERLIESDQIQVRGEHNLLNIAAAALACHTVGVSREALREGVAGFKGLEHRLEYVGTADEVSFYDDSFATAPDPTIIALKAFSGPIILIAGGADKGADFTGLAEEILRAHIRAVILVGATGPRIGEAISNVSEALSAPSPEMVSGGMEMWEIVAQAVERAEPGDVVLLSTACASFGLFRNYKERGDQFKNEVRKLPRFTDSLI